MNDTAQNSAPEWETPLPLESRTVQSFLEDGVVKLSNVFSAETLETVGKELFGLVARLGSSVDEGNRGEEYPSEDIDLYRKAFTQVFNLWTHRD